MPEWAFTAVNAAFALVCCWQASKATDNRISTRLSRDDAYRYFEWARSEANYIREIARGRR